MKLHRQGTSNTVKFHQRTTGLRLVNSEGEVRHQSLTNSTKKSEEHVASHVSKVRTSSLSGHLFLLLKGLVFTAVSVKKSEWHLSHWACGFTETIPKNPWLLNTAFHLSCSGEKKQHSVWSVNYLYTWQYDPDVNTAVSLWNSFQIKNVSNTFSINTDSFHNICFNRGQSILVSQLYFCCVFCIFFGCISSTSLRILQ